MRRRIVKLMTFFVTGLAFALGGNAVMSEEGPATNVAAAKADAGLGEEAKRDKSFRIPPGYRTKTRGDKTVYCRKAAELGSRFKVEKCFSEEQLKIELERIQMEKEEFERGRRQCVTASVCAQN
ncbi:MAG: hypothetical protein WAW79_09270 [Steroidobacteraceae bacterium]